MRERKMKENGDKKMNAIPVKPERACDGGTMEDSFFRFGDF